MIDEQQTRRSSFWRELPILLGVAIVVAILVRLFVIQTFYIPSISMENTLEVNDRILANKLVYEFRDPERGEIVVFEAPPEWRSNPDDDEFIKRVIGIGGDTVACCDPRGRLFVNGHPLDEPYLYTSPDGVTDPAASAQFEVTVPDGRLWMMGDHRSFSGDSLEHYRTSDGDLQLATIDIDDVIGRAFVRIWPLGRAGGLGVPEVFESVPDRPMEQSLPVPPA